MEGYRGWVWRIQALAPMMDERMRRCWAATEAQAYGWGGVRAVSSATGLSPNTIRKGLAELSGKGDRFIFQARTCLTRRWRGTPQKARRPSA